MAIQTTSNLTNSIRTQYIGQYLAGAVQNRLYDQFSAPYTNWSAGLSMKDLMMGSAVQINFLSGMTPGTTAISQTSDITPQTLTDAIATITPTSRGEALQWSEILGIETYTNLMAERFKKLGENQMYSVDLLAQAAALQGTLIYRYAARASLDAGTPDHRASDVLFARMEGWLQDLRVPSFINADGTSQSWMALMHPFAFHDIRESGNVDSIGTYQDEGIHLNFELGKIGPFRLVVNGWSKVFHSAGLANGTPVATTLNGAVAKLATSVVVAANTNIAAGKWYTIGTLETVDTHYATNERVYCTAISGTTVSILGEGENGGLKYDHESGETFSNADSVYPIAFGGPESLVKVFAQEVGEYGTVVGPEVTGLLKQFEHLGWKWYGGYNRLVDNRILRVEVSTSFEA